MKNVKRLAALLLALVLLMTPIISVQAKETIGTAKDKTLYYFDLERFLNEAENDKVHYDYLKLASALQGLANRDEPRLYFRYYDMDETDFAMEHLTDHVEQWWLEQITDDSNGYGKLKDGGDLADYQIVEVENYWSLFSLFRDSYEGIVLWDEEAPATANVASTIAGVENLLPVRLSGGEYDVYTQMLKHGFRESDVKRSLCGMFKGTGYIPTLGSSVPRAKMEYTTTPSTQSVKTDPYLWAKMFYLDTGLTNPTMMSFAIDGGSWEYQRSNAVEDPENKNRGELLSASIPDRMRPGERREVSFTYENIGESEWTWANYDRLAISTDGIPAEGDDFHFYVNADTDDGYTSNHDRLFLGQREKIEPGQTAQFKGYLQAPVTQGTYKVQFIMWNDLTGPISLPLKHTIEVTPDARPDPGPQEPAYHPLEKAEYTDEEFDAEIIMAGIPAVVEPGQSVTAEVSVKNVGTGAWKAGEFALVCGNQTVLLAADTASGKTAKFTVNFTAPGAEGDFTVTLQMKNDTADVGDVYECKLKAEKPEEVAEYDCEIVAMKYEKGLEVGAKSASYVEVVNTGSKTWTAADGIKLAETSGEQFMSTTAHDDDAGVLLSELKMEDGVEVKPGEHYFFHFDLHSYTNTGSGKLYLEPESILDLELQITGKNGAFGDAASINLITYEPCKWAIKTFAEANDVPMSSKDRDATILWASVPKTIEAGTTEQFRVAIKNTGSIAWTRHVGLAEYNMVNLGIGSATMLVATAADGTNADSGSKNRIRIPGGLTVQPGEVLVMSGYLLAPEDTLAGTYDYNFHCVVDSVTAGVGGPVGNARTFSIAVTNLAAQAELAAAEALEASVAAEAREEEIVLELPEALEEESNTTVSFTQKVRNASQEAYIASLVEDNVPDEMEAGSAVAMTWKFRNDGTATWGGYNNADAVPFNFVVEILDQTNGTSRTDTFRLSRGQDTQKNWREVGNWMWPNVCGQTNGQTLSPGGYLLAPTNPGVYTLKIGVSTNMKADRQNYKFSYEKTINVTGEKTLDTVIKDASETEFIAQLVADTFPDKMTVGENGTFSATFANTGTATWLSRDIGWNFQMQMIDHTSGEDRTENFLFSRRPDPTAAGATAGSFYYQGGSSSVAPGSQWTLNGYLHAPTTPGVYTLKFGVTTAQCAGGWYKYAFEKTIVVESGKTASMTQVVRNASQAAYIATLIENNIPDEMEAGTAVAMTWKFRNDGTEKWNGYNETGFNFVVEILDQADGTSRTNTFRLSRGQDAQKNWRNVGNWMWPNTCGQTNGQTLSPGGYLLAPTTPGVYTLKIGVSTSMKADRQNYKFSYEKEIVVGEASASMRTKVKDASETAFMAELIADSIPDAMQVGENKNVSIRLRNIGTATWKSLDHGKANCNNQLVLVGEENNTDRTSGFRLSRNEAFTNSAGNYFFMGGMKECAPGRVWNYNLWLHAPTTEGYYTLKIGLDTREANGGWYTYYFEKTIKVGNPTTQPEESTETEIKDPSQVPVGTNAYDGVIVSADMPENMKTGELTPISITVKNTGTNTWFGFISGSSRAMRLSPENAQGFGFYTDPDGTKTGATGAGHIDIPSGVAVASGDTYTFTAYLKAPTVSGIYALKMIPYSGSGGWHTAGGHTFDIRVSRTGGTYTPTEPTYTSDRRDAEVVVSSIPTAVETGTKSQITVWMKNSGKETWTPGTETEGYFLRYKIAGRTAGYAPVTETVAPGEKTKITLNYEAPDFEDNYSIQVQMVCLNKGGYRSFGDKIGLRADTDNSLGVKNAEILSIHAPEEMPEGTKGEVVVEVLNTGSMTWDNNVALADQGTNAYMSKTGTEGDADALLSAVTIEPGVEVATGERYIFRFDLHTWTNNAMLRVYEAPGTTISQKLRMAALEGEHAGTFGDEFEIESLVTQIPVESELTVYADPDDVEMSGEWRDYEIISASVPTNMNGSQIVPVTFTVKNTGNVAWVKHDGQYALHKMRLAMVSEGKEFGLYTDLNGVTSHSGDKNRIDIQTGETVMPGEVYTFNVYLKAPAYTGSYKIELYLTADGVGPEFSQQARGDSKTYTILVDGTARKGEDVYTNEGIMYQDAKNNPFYYTQLASADLYIAEKAFFFDLWIDDTATPIDDRWQPIGTDERVLREVLNSQRKRAQAYEDGTDPWNKITGEVGTGTFVVDGFPPWWLKYSGVSDPMSSYADSASEQLFVDFIGEYGGWMDADAAGTVSLSNCSVFNKLELQVGEYAKKITQMQPDFDKSVGDPSVVYDPNTTYVVFFMGDWDGGAWNGNRMHAVYNDPRRGEIPVVWPIASGLSYRIPHVHNMMYDRATPNDFFAASDNGIGYLSWNYMADPRTEKSGITKAEGLEIHNDFVDLSKEFYEIYDIDIMTWYILCGHPDGLTEKATEALATLHPYGVITNELVDPYIQEDGTVTIFQPYNGWASNLGTEQMKIDAAARLAAYIKFDRQFLWLRSCKANVSRICETLEIMDEQNPGLNYKVVDPYTYFRLMKEASGGRSSGAKYSYTAPKAMTVAIDGKASKGEWDGAAEMVISPTSEEISKHGFNWAPSNLKTEDDLKSTYKIKWDEQYLYVLEERIDDDAKFADPAVNSMQWLVDGSGIYMDTDDDDSGYFAGDFAVLFNRTQDGKPSVWLRSGQAGGGVVQRKLEPHEFKAAITAGENGNYTYELAINWSVVTSGYRPSADAEVGMTMLALDGDLAYSNTRQIMWHGNGDTQANWGILKFSN